MSWLPRMSIRLNLKCGTILQSVLSVMSPLCMQAPDGDEQHATMLDQTDRRWKIRGVCSSHVYQELNGRQFALRTWWRIVKTRLSIVSSRYLVNSAAGGMCVPCSRSSPVVRRDFRLHRATTRRSGSLLRRSSGLEQLIPFSWDSPKQAVPDGPNAVPENDWLYKACQTSGTACTRSNLVTVRRCTSWLQVLVHFIFKPELIMLGYVHIVWWVTWDDVTAVLPRRATRLSFGGLCTDLHRGCLQGRRQADAFS